MEALQDPVPGWPVPLVGWPPEPEGDAGGEASEDVVPIALDPPPKVSTLPLLAEAEEEEPPKVEAQPSAQAARSEAAAPAAASTQAAAKPAEPPAAAQPAAPAVQSAANLIHIKLNKVQAEGQWAGR